MPNLVTLKDPRSPAAEAYRVLRTIILFSALEKPIQTLIVTSPTPDDGKSTTLANLAVTMAQSEHPTILVDADLRRPSQHSIGGIANDVGLTSMVLDDVMMKRPPLHDGGVDNMLAILTSGPIPPNPADLISGKRMTDVIQV